MFYGFQPDKKINRNNIYKKIPLGVSPDRLAIIREKYI